MTQENNEIAIDKVRYRRITRFFAGVVVHLVWWDVILRRVVPGRVLSSRPARWRTIARQFRNIAVSMGGVLIKLGQFLSSRVDVLPVEITAELQGLQDEVPAVDIAGILAVLGEDLGDLGETFTEFERTPLAAASLGQAHRAWLPPRTDHSPGTPVVVKVQRPGIVGVVQTDLAALAVVAQWAMRYRPIRRRANVPALMEEFASTLWEELDYRAEVDNAERFAKMFADNEGVHVPFVYRELCSGRVIVLENVEGLKVTDLQTLEAVGIDPQQVAERLLDTYFHQIFKEGFFHADPHPGNLFLLPLEGKQWPETSEQSPVNGQPVNHQPPVTNHQSPTPFRLIFIDFGMVGRISDKMSQSLQKWLLSIMQRDAQGLTDVYQDLGFFLPGADLDRITEAQTVVLDQIWGRNLLEMARPDPREVQELGSEFRDILFEFPFQVPQDFIYLGRALGMLSGLATQLDPAINPWYQIEKYGRDIVTGQAARQAGFDTIIEFLKPFVTFPGQLQRTLTAIEKGQVRIQTVPDKATTRRLERVEKQLGRLQLAILGAAGLISATLYHLHRRR